MTENRIRELRRRHNMSQEALGTIINTTQQAVSKMEKDTCAISTDLLISMARYFNVTTDYILGLSDIKTDLSGQIRMNQEMDQCYDIVLRYNNLTDTNKKDTPVSSQTFGTGTVGRRGSRYSRRGT